MQRALGVLVVAIGCGPVVTSDDAGDSAADDTGQDSSGGGTSATTTATTVATATDPTAATSVGSATMTTAEPVGCDGEFVSGCQAVCAATITCDPESGTYEECVTDCVDALTTSLAECQTAQCKYLTCVGAASCAELDSGATICEEFLPDVTAYCTGDGGECFVGAGPGSCEYGCDRTEIQRMRCDAEVCTCFEDDVQTGQCAANGICNSLDGISKYALECCGW